MGTNGQTSNTTVNGRRVRRRAVSRPDFPAKFNVKFTKTRRGKDVALNDFMDKHGDAKREHGVIVDTEGFVLTYRHGGNDYVAWDGIQDLVRNAQKQNAKYDSWDYNKQTNGLEIYHNHPNGTPLSGQDLRMMIKSKSSGVHAVHGDSKSGYAYSFVALKNKKPNYQEAFNLVNQYDKAWNDVNVAIQKRILRGERFNGEVELVRALNKEFDKKMKKLNKQFEEYGYTLRKTEKGNKK